MLLCKRMWLRHRIKSQLLFICACVLTVYYVSMPRMDNLDASSLDYPVDGDQFREMNRAGLNEESSLGVDPIVYDDYWNGDEVKEQRKKDFLKFKMADRKPEVFDGKGLEAKLKADMINPHEFDGKGLKKRLNAANKIDKGEDFDGKGLAAKLKADDDVIKPQEFDGEGLKKRLNTKKIDIGDAFDGNRLAARLKADSELHDKLKEPNRDDIQQANDAIQMQQDEQNAQEDNVNAQQDGVNAQQDGVNAKKDGVNAQQDGVNAKQDNVIAPQDENGNAGQIHQPLEEQSIVDDMKRGANHDTMQELNDTAEVNNTMNDRYKMQNNQLIDGIEQRERSNETINGEINDAHQLDVKDAESVRIFRERRFEAAQRRAPRDGPGEMGQPVVLSEEEKQQAGNDEEAMKHLGSSKIAVDRAIPDTRYEVCKTAEYPRDLPTVSVIMIFCNEPLSPLLRCAHSVVNRTPPQYLKEVLMVDDASDHEDLLAPMDEYVRQTWPDGVVRILRRSKRGGLIRARMTGARAAVGDVIVIMDGHMEVNVGWAEPILARIKEKPNTVIVPMLDTILDNDWSYTGGDQVFVTGFMWSLLYIWKAPIEPVTDYLKPVKSPTIMGCAFAADRKYFFDIGAFDEGMDIWGGENIEMPFRVWMCGGSVELLPCSRVGHMYRTGKRPYTFDGKDTLAYNGKRLAEVWMDDYKRIFYRRRPELINVDVGDLSERHAFRKDRECHSFKWYLENVEPDKFIFDENVSAWGRVENAATNMCVDTMSADEQQNFEFKVYRCQDPMTAAEMMGLSLQGELRMEVRCMDFIPNKFPLKVYGHMCHGQGGNQKWEHDRASGHIIHVASGQCLTMMEAKDGGDLSVAQCNHNSTDTNQTWRFTYYMDTDIM